MYIPKSAENLKDRKIPSIRLGLQAPPGGGKTYSALTFPNIVVSDFDNGLTAFVGDNIITLPFWNPNWVSNYGGEGKFKITKPGNNFPNARDAFKHFLKTEAKELTEEQTLFIDSWTFLQKAFDEQTYTEPAATKKGEEDGFAYWAAKLEYNYTIMTLLNNLRCHVVVSFHEFQARAKDGTLLDKAQPVQDGKFATYLKSFFSDYFRCVNIEPRDGNGQPKVNEPITYHWQVMSDNRFDAKSRCKNWKSKLMPAHYDTLANAYQISTQ